MKKSIILMVAPALLCASGLWANEQLNQQLRSAAEASDVARVELLLDRGAEIDARARDGDTALKLAADQGHRDVINVLRGAGATR